MNNEERTEHHTNGALRTVIIDTTLLLAGEIGWSQVNLQKIAEQADLLEHEVKAIFSSEWQILEAFRKRTDLQITGGQHPNWSTHAAKDRLFEVLMERIETIAPWKPGLASVARYGLKQPVAGLRLLAALNNSMVTMLDYAELRTGSPGLIWQSHGLSVIYLLTLRRWFSDESSDLGPTMAELSEKLTTADRFMARMCARGR